MGSPARSAHDQTQTAANKRPGRHVIAGRIGDNGAGGRTDHCALGIIAHAPGQGRGKNCHKKNGSEHLVLPCFERDDGPIPSDFAMTGKENFNPARKAAKRPGGQRTGPSWGKTGLRGREG